MLADRPSTSARAERHAVQLTRRASCSTEARSHAQRMTKDAIRHKVWTRVTAAGVVRFPGAYGRIPNFVGAERAARLLAS